MLWSLLIVILLTRPEQGRGFFGLTSPEAIFTPASSDNTVDTSPNTPGNDLDQQELCKLLGLNPKQKRKCEMIEGLGPLLLEALGLSVTACQKEFEHERWNCSLDYGRVQILSKGFKETAFLHAITSAAITHSISRACSSQRLDRCTCDQSYGRKANKQAWKWGGCGDNVKYGQKFARRFLGPKTWGNDIKALVDKHNSKVGIRTVQKSVRTICKCHGVSASCEIRTCWKELSPFNNIASELKDKYQHASQVTVYENSVRSRANPAKLVRTSRNVERSGGPKKGQLVYMDKSPQFCFRSIYSPGISGSRCKDREGCDELCCGRGYNTEHVTVSRPCRCKVAWCCDVKCDTCTEVQEIFTCK